MKIGNVAVVNTHIKWASEDETNHIGTTQTAELLKALDKEDKAIILADCNGQPGGRVQTMVEQAGFTSMSGEMPTAIVNREPVALDLLAIRGLKGTLITTQYDLRHIPNEACASNHIPVVADVSLVHSSTI